MCGNCLSVVRPILDHEKDIVSWKVDLTHPEKILEVNGEQLDAKSIQALLQNAGYELEPK